MEWFQTESHRTIYTHASAHVSKQKQKKQKIQQN